MAALAGGGAATGIADADGDRRSSPREVVPGDVPGTLAAIVEAGGYTLAVGEETATLTVERAGSVDRRGRIGRHGRHGGDRPGHRRGRGRDSGRGRSSPNGWWTDDEADDRRRGHAGDRSDDRGRRHGDGRGPSRQRRRRRPETPTCTTSSDRLDATSSSSLLAPAKVLAAL